MTPPNKPRPADIAIAVTRLLSGLLRQIWKMSFRQLAPGNMGASLLLMKLSFRIAISTVDQDPLTITKLAKFEDMPPSTLKRYVELLVKHHRVKMRASRKRGRGQQAEIIFVELERLDRLMTLEHTDWCIELTETHLNEMKRLRQLLWPELAANGKKAAE